MRDNTKIFILLLSIIFAIKLYPQENWYWQNPLPQGNNLFRVQFVNTNTAYAIGGASTVLKTTDAGAKWAVTEYAGGSNKILTSLYFRNENDGWTGGYDGKLLHTTNAGAQWDSVTGQFVQIITGVSFPNPLLGVIVTSYQNSLCCASIYQTTDGGVTWSNRPIPAGSDYNLKDVSFANDTLGIAVGLFGIILRTTDGGTTWQSVNGSTTENLNSIDHIGDNLWMIAGNGRIIIKSTDAGTSWTESFHGLTNSFRGIDMVDENTAYVCGYEGEIRKTTDGGLSWTLQQSNTPKNLFGISFSGVSTGIGVGIYGVIVRTTNGGSSWQVVSEGTTQDLEAVEFADNQTGFTCGAGGTLLKTLDQGGMWQPFNSGVSQTLYGLSFTNNSTGTAVGDDGIIIRTTDGGESWMPQSSGITSPGRLTDVSFINENTGFAVGYNSSSVAAIRKTTDGGNTWMISQPVIDNLLYSVDFYNVNHGIVVGGNGAIIYTTDSGNSWLDRSLGFGYTFSSVQMADDSFAVIAGYNYNVFPAVGVIYVTTDGGDSWMERSNGNYESFASAYFWNEMDGIACGSYGKVYSTTDGGMSWSSELSGTENTLNSVTLTGAGQAFIVGEGGDIISNKQIVTHLETNKEKIAIPKKYNLYQNYPNPFNPTTTIEYSIPERTNVKLTVINIVGEEVAELVNQTMDAGNYSVVFDSHSGKVRNLPSGVYIYTLQAGNFVTSKKMILLK